MDLNRVQVTYRVQKHKTQLEVGHRGIIDVINVGFWPTPIRGQIHVQSMASLCVYYPNCWIFVGTKLSSGFKENTFKRDGVGRPNYTGDICATVSYLYVS